ncbi:hypothetical protein M8J77_021311 [Diaphorina citri]|nr:hypothetical protein M8J77_021311 [Diaphorina citri]
MDDILNIKQWLNHQLHIPALSDEFILLFLHSCYYSIERTKDTIDNYFTVRAQCSDLFKGRGDSKYLLQQLEYYDMMALPNLTPDKSRIVMYRLRNDDLSIFNYADTLRAFFAVNDLFISEDGLMEGYVVVFDMSGLSFGHLAKTTTQLNLVKNFMVYIQECHPVRLKSIHVINTYPLIDKILAIIKPMMQANIIQMLHLHPSLDTLAEYFPLSILPSDYTGGQSDSVQVQQEQTKKLVKKYASWLKDFEQFEANEKKRVGKPRKQMVGAELGGSFKTLSID